MTLLNTLPVVIDGPGEYVARNGHRVTINEVKPHTSNDTTAFAAKGSMWKMFRGNYQARGYQIWHISGRAYPLDEAGIDVVAKYDATKHDETPPWN